MFVNSRRLVSQGRVDACVVEGAIRRRDFVISSDPGDLRAIAAATSHQLDIDHP